LFAFTFRGGFLGVAFSLAFIVDEGREVLPFSLPEGCVVTLRERVVRMLAAAAAAVAARVGMGAGVLDVQQCQEKKKEFFFQRSLTACDRSPWSSWSVLRKKIIRYRSLFDDGGGILRRMPNESQS
jgi:hypothetical protein